MSYPYPLRSPLSFLCACSWLILSTYAAPAQAPSWVLLDNSLSTSSIHSLTLGPDQRLYVVGYTGTALEYPQLGRGLSLWDLYVSSDAGNSLLKIADDIAPMHPLFLPDSRLLISSWGVTVYPNWGYFWMYPNYPDSAIRDKTFGDIWYDYLETDRTSTGTFVLASRFSGNDWSSERGMLWIVDSSRGIDRRLPRNGGITDVAIAGKNRIYFSEARWTDYGYTHTFFCRTDDLGETIDTLQRDLLIGEFVIAGEDILIAYAVGVTHEDSRVEFDIESSGTYRSVDGGLSWTRVLQHAWVENLGNDERYIYPDGKNGWFLVSYERRLLPDWKWTQVLYRSTDQGATWVEQPAFIGGYIEDLQVAEDGALYVLSMGVIHGSADRGVTWKDLSGPVPFRNFVVLPDGALVASGKTEGMYRLVYPLSVNEEIQEPEENRLNLR